MIPLPIMQFGFMDRPPLVVRYDTFRSLLNYNEKPWNLTRTGSLRLV